MADKPKSDPAGSEGQPQTSSMVPGDEAPPGTPGTGEAVCPDCSGTGVKDGKSCPTCAGTGKIVEGIGGA